jgi:hypothetical protein
MEALDIMAMELRHNDEAVGRVSSGTVDVDHDGLRTDVRFWLGLRALLTRSACAVASSKPRG